MEFIETDNFTKRVVILLKDEQYLELQKALIKNPALGRLIPGFKGIRKLRWGTSTKGKRGGIRIIYYWHLTKSIILMLYVYNKSQMGDMGRRQLRQLICYVMGGAV